MSLICFVDDTELKLPEDTNVTKTEEITPEVVERTTYVLAGYLVKNGVLNNLSEAVARVKSEVGLEWYDPIKWNFKDIEKLYEDRSRKSQYNRALRKSEGIRERMLRLLETFDARIVACAVARFKEQTPRKDCIGWAAENFFQRVGLVVKDQIGLSYPSLTLIMDWPPTNQVNAILSAYYSGYKNGMTVDAKQQYFSGSLSNLQALDCPLFAKMIYLPFLQLADLIAGATREFLIWAYTGKKKQRAEKFFGIIAPQFVRNREGGISKYGLKVSPEPEFDLDQKVREIASI